MRKRFPLYVYLDKIRSLYNVGAFFRTCDAANVSKIYISWYSPVPPRKEITKTALGAEMAVPFEHVQNPIGTLQKFKRKGIQIVCVETGEEKRIPYMDFKPQFPLVVVFGNEITGIADDILELADAAISIPMYGIKESLNVVVAGGIVLYDMVQKYLKENSSC